MGAIAYLQLRQVLGEKKIFFIAVFLAIPILLSLAFEGPGTGEVQRSLAAGVFLYLLYPQTTCMLLALLYGTSIVNAELEAKTITYLFTRPIPKWKVIVAKYGAIVGCLAVPSIASLAISWAIIGGAGGGLFFGLCLATAGAVATYTAIFAAIGVFFNKRPMILGLIYGVSEIMLSFIPALVSTMTVTYFLRSFVIRMVDVEIPEEILRLIGGASLPVAFLAILGMIAAALALACWAGTKREYIPTEQV